MEDAPTHIERRIRMIRDASGHKPLTATVTEAPGAMPIAIGSGDDAVYLRWSEWDEVRDHIEISAQAARPEPAEALIDEPARVCGVQSTKETACVIADWVPHRMHVDSIGHVW